MALEPIGNHWRVAFEVDGRRVEREVQVLSNAATWAESWLLPRLAPVAPACERAPETAPAGVAAPYPEEAPDAVPALPSRPSQRDHEELGASERTTTHSSTDVESGLPGESRLSPAAPSGQLASLGQLALTQDASVWGGAGLSGQLILSGGPWFGASFTHWWVPLAGERSATQGEPRWRVQEVAVRAGWRIQLVPALATDVGIGAGLATGQVHGERGFSDDENATIVDWIGTLAYEPIRHWVLLAGLSAGVLLTRGNVGAAGAPSSEESLPALPVARAAFVFGMGYHVGGPK